MVTILSPEEVKHETRVWAANAKAPLTRDEQIALMTASRNRQSRINHEEPTEITLR